jgi:hypothetical protein
MTGESVLLWIVFGLALLVGYGYARRLGDELKGHKAEIDRVNLQISELRSAMAELINDFEKTLSPQARDDRYFERQPLLTERPFIKLHLTPGDRLSLLHRSSIGGVHLIEYKHGKTYQEGRGLFTDGEARFSSDEQGEFREVRMLVFSDHRTAALRGLGLDGDVKLG